MNSHVDLKTNLRHLTRYEQILQEMLEMDLEDEEQLDLLLSLQEEQAAVTAEIDSAPRKGNGQPPKEYSDILNRCVILQQELNGNLHRVRDKLEEGFNKITKAKQVNRGYETNYTTAFGYYIDKQK